MNPAESNPGQPNPEIPKLSEQQNPEVPKFGGLTKQEIVDLRPIIFKFCRPYCETDDQAEDFTQATILKAINAKNPFEARGGAKASTWIIQIAFNEMRQANRRKKQYSITDKDKNKDENENEHHDHLDIPDTKPHHENATIDKIYLGQLIKAAGLSKKELKLINWKNVDGFTYKEIEAKTKISEKTLRSQIFRAEEKLRKAADKLKEKPEAT